MSEDRPAEEENRDETGGATKTHIGLDDGLVKEVRNALAEENATLIAALAAPLHPADLADLLQLFGAEARESIVTALGPAFDPDTLPYLDDGVREELFEKLDPEDASKFISELETDDAIDVLIDLDDEQKDAILASLPHPDRAVLEQGLSYPEDSAGRLM